MFADDDEGGGDYEGSRQEDADDGFREAEQAEHGEGGSVEVGISGKLMDCIDPLWECVEEGEGGEEEGEDEDPG